MKIKWNTGHPDNDRMVLVCRENIKTGVRDVTRTFYWEGQEDPWLFGIAPDSQVIAWAEIPDPPTFEEIPRLEEQEGGGE